MTCYVCGGTREVIETYFESCNTCWGKGYLEGTKQPTNSNTHFTSAPGNVICHHCRSGRIEKKRYVRCTSCPTTQTNWPAPDQSYRNDEVVYYSTERPEPVYRDPEKVAKDQAATVRGIWVLIFVGAVWYYWDGIKGLFFGKPEVHVASVTALPMTPKAKHQSNQKLTTDQNHPALNAGKTLPKSTEATSLLPMGATSTTSARSTEFFADRTTAAEPHHMSQLLIGQAVDVLRLVEYGKTEANFPIASAEFGPGNGHAKYPFGWHLENADGRFVILADVHESTVRQFNLEVHGRGEDIRYRGANALPGHLPYGGYTRDSRYWILFPLDWLKSPANQTKRVIG